MTIRLIVNADDYGRSANISKGIREAHLSGIVSSTTCMMNMPGVVDDIGTALRDTPRLGLGVHLLLTAGRPLLAAQQVESLVQPDGAFLHLDQLIARHTELDAAQAQAEWHAQIEKFMAAAKRKPTHLDSHHHASYLTPGLFRAMLELAKEYDLPIRLPVAQEANAGFVGLPSELVDPIVEHAPSLLQQFQPRHPDAFFISFYDQGATSAELFRILASLAEGSSELMSHPGYSDADLEASSGYALQRERELTILTSAETVAEVKRRNIELINFSQL